MCTVVCTWAARPPSSLTILCVPSPRSVTLRPWLGPAQPTTLALPPVLACRGGRSYGGKDTLGQRLRNKGPKTGEAEMKALSRTSSVHKKPGQPQTWVAVASRCARGPATAVGALRAFCV